jgi:hypothetical protein
MLGLGVDLTSALERWEWATHRVDSDTLIEIEIEIEIVYNMYRRFTPITVCARCCLWALPTMPYMELTSQG